MKNGHFTNIRPGRGVIDPPRGLPAICSPMTVGFYMVTSQTTTKLHVKSAIFCLSFDVGVIEIMKQRALGILVGR